MGVSNGLYGRRSEFILVCIAAISLGCHLNHREKSSSRAETDLIRYARKLQGISGALMTRESSMRRWQKQQPTCPLIIVARFATCRWKDVQEAPASFREGAPGC
jgi:hypothetical protein